MLLKFDLLNTCSNIEWISNQEWYTIFNLNLKSMFIKNFNFFDRIDNDKKLLKIQYLLHLKYKSYKTTL